MTTFYMMVGISGSGKSTYARAIAENAGATIISSDSFREQEYGSEAIQGDNAKLFEKINVAIRSALSVGQNVVFDATNIVYKNRKLALDNIRSLNVVKIAVVVMADIKTCKAQNASRERNVPEYVIDRMWKSFTMPQYIEGFDEIRIIVNGYDKTEYVMDELFDKMNFEQDNPHHSETLSRHTENVIDGVKSQTSDYRLIWAALLHDNGKRFTKTYKNAKGETSNFAHYYSHENVGAYEAVFYLKEMNVNTSDIVHVCGLIQNHMRMYSLGTEKAKAKLISQVGQSMFYDLVILNKADAEGK